MKRTVSGKGDSKSSGSLHKPPRRKRSRPAFVLCVSNEGCDDLELRKVYRVLPDRVAAKDGYVRVIDESGEDHLYPAKNFVAVALPESAAKSLALCNRDDG